jgi:hypothetical protein
MKKIFKAIILSPIFIIGSIFMIIGAIGLFFLILGETILKKIEAL